eukprot:SAG31_NODE_1320_length_8809_cov_4.243398_5_plen_141_part_00
MRAGVARARRSGEAQQSEQRRSISLHVTWCWEGNRERQPRTMVTSDLCSEGAEYHSAQRSQRNRAQSMLQEQNDRVAKTPRIHLQIRSWAVSTRLNHIPMPTHGDTFSISALHLSIKVPYFSNPEWAQKRESNFLPAAVA